MDNSFLKSEAITIHCPNCGAPLNINQQVCNYCKSDVVKTSIDSILNKKEFDIQSCILAYKEAVLNNGEIKDYYILGVALYKIGLYDEAKEYLKKGLPRCINFPDIYFFYVLALIGDKKPFLLSLKDAKESIKYLSIGYKISKDKKHKALQAYILSDYFDRKHLGAEITTIECLIELEEMDINNVIKKYLGGYIYE